MIYLRNQAYPFDIAADECDCCDENDIDQLVNQSDVTQFQNLIDVSGFAPQVVDDPSFSLTVGGGSPWTIVSPTWTVGGGQLCKVLNGAASASTSFQNGVFVIGNYYQVNVSVDSLSGGVFDLTLGGNAFEISAIGDYTFYIQASADGVRVFGDDDVLGCLSRVDAYEVFPQHTKILIKDSTGTVIEQLNITDNPDAFEIIDNSITNYIDWTQLGIDEGCYTICIADPNINSGGQNFLYNNSFDIDGFSGDENTTGWLLTNGTVGTWQITGGGLEYNSSGAGDIGLAEHIFTEYEVGTLYDVEVVVSAVTDTQLSVKIGTVAGPSINAVGTYNFQITPDDTDLNLTTLTAGAGATDITIDSITVTKANTEDYVCNEEGPRINLGNHHCTHLVNACHNGPAAGFNFDGGFSPTIRLKSKIGRATYSGTRVANKLSNGSYLNVYYDRDKIKEFQIDFQPEYVYDFLSLMLGFKYWAIDGVRRHLQDDELTPTYTDGLNCNATHVMNIITHPQQNDPAITFRDCTGLATSCTNSNFLVQEEDNSLFITQTDGGKIIINP